MAHAPSDLHTLPGVITDDCWGRLVWTVITFEPLRAAVSVAQLGTLGRRRVQLPGRCTARPGR